MPLAVHGAMFDVRCSMCGVRYNPAMVLLLACMLVQDASKLIKEGDAAWVKRAEDGQPAKAVQAYKKALAIDESSAEAYWKIARVAFWTGDHEKETEKQARIYREAIDYAKLAVDADKNCVAAHFWLAFLYGLFGQAKGIFQALDLIEPMKAEAEWVVAHDETFESGGAHRLLGMLYYKLPGIKGGDIEKAKKHLARAVELAPKFFTNRLLYAQVLAHDGKKDEAKKQLKAAMELPEDPDWEPEIKQDRVEAKKLLDELNK